MSIETNGTLNTSGTPESYTYTESYSVVYASATTYKVTITSVEAGQSITETVWVLRNGTAIAINFAGENLTGSEAQSLIVGAFGGFTEQIQADSEIGFYTATNFFHSTGTSTVSIGPTQVSVTTYVANNLPETVTSCGSTTTLTAYSLSVGTPQGTSSPLVTYEHIAGSEVVNGQTETFNEVIQVMSITVA